MLCGAICPTPATPIFELTNSATDRLPWLQVNLFPPVRTSLAKTRADKIALDVNVGFQEMRMAERAEENAVADSVSGRSPTLISQSSLIRTFGIGVKNPQ